MTTRDLAVVDDTGRLPAAPTAPPSPTSRPLGARGFGRPRDRARFVAEHGARQRVEAAVAFHLAGKLPGVEWTGAVKPLADRWWDMFGGHAQAVAALENDVNALAAMTDRDIAERMMRGEPLTQFDDVWDAIAEVAWEVGATDLARRFNEEAADSVKGTFTSLTTPEATQLVTRLISRDIEEGAAPPTGRFDPRVRADKFTTLFDVPGAWSYSPTSNLLVVTVGEQTVGIEPRAGFDPADHLDVLAEVVSAQADGRVKGGEITGGQAPGAVERMIGLAHSVGGAIESNDFAREFVDVLWNSLEPGDLDASREELRDSKGRLTEESVRLASMIPFPEDAMVASVARLWMSENPQLRSSDALAQAADVVAENREQFVSEFERLTQEELLEQLEAETEGKSPIGVTVERYVGQVLTAMEWWDRFSQTVGVAVIDTVRDFLMGVEELEIDHDWEAGFQHFKDMFDVPTELTTAAEYFGLEGEAAEWANFTTGLVFDPTNFMFPGAKGIRAMARRALVQPEKFGRLYLRMGEFPSIIKKIANATRFEGGEVATITRLVDGEEVAKTVRVGARVVTDQQAQTVRTIAAMSGLPDDAYVDLFRLAMDPASTREQVEDVFLRAMKSDWLGEGPFRAVRRSTIEGIGKTLESIANGSITDEQADTLIRMFSRMNTGRTFRLGENQSLDSFMDLLIQLYPADSESFTRWALEALERRAAAADGFALSGTAAMTKEAARRELHNAGGVMSAASRARGDLGGIAHNLSTIEETLANFDQLGLGVAPDPDFLRTGEDLFHGTRRAFDRFDPSQAGGPTSRGRSTGPQLESQGAKFYFSDDPAVASRFAEAGIPEASLSELVERAGATSVEDLTPDDLVSVFDENSTVLVATDIDAAGGHVYEVAQDPADLLAKIQASELDADEIVLRRLRSDASPRVVRTQVFGERLDLSGFMAIDEMPEGLLEALEADGLVRRVNRGQMYPTRGAEGVGGFQRATTDGVILEGWQTHERSFKNTAEWMRAHGYGKAVVPDSIESGGVSVVGLAEFIGSPEEVAARAGKMVDQGAQVRDQLLRLHELMSARWEGVQPVITKAKDRARTARKRLKQATYLEADAAANAQRNVMAGIAAELYEEVAQRINARFGDDTIPVIKGKSNPLAPDVPVRDWSRVTGVKRFIAGDDPDLGLMMGLAVDDAAQAQALGAVGMFNRSQHVLLEASPYEVTLFEKLAHNETALSNATRILRNEFVKKVSRSMKMVFAFNLLLNPLTAGRISLDETLRFFADTGEFLKFLEASLVGFPGVGAAVERGLKWSRSRWGEAMVNPYALRYRRNVGAWFPDDFGSYQWVERPPRRVGKGEFSRTQYREQVERWVNGSLLNDRRFQQWARWVDDAQVLADGTKIPPQGWIDWWENGTETTRPGKLEARTVKVTIRDQVKAGTDLTATEAFNIIDRSVNYWLDLVVDHGAQDGLRQRLIKAATTPGDKLDLVKDARWLNAIERVPGLAGGEGILNNIFQVMFGAPQGRRAGVFYEHFYDEAFQTLRERHADRLITVDMLMDYAKVDRQTAEFWLRQGTDNKVVSELVRQTGMRTESQLTAAAARYAERRADDLMFRFTASSMAGRGVEAGLMFPFARAQTDFLSWWWDHLTKPMQVRLPLEVRAKLPEFVQNALAGVEHIPINLRALARYAHLAAATNNENEGSLLDQVIDTVTFFPLEFGQGFLMDVAPAPGPIPDWLFDIAVDKGVIPDDVVDTIHTLYPAMAFSEFDGDLAGDLFNRILPTSPRSIRDATVGMLRAAYTIFGKDIHTDPGLMGKIANFLADGRMPGATGDFHAAAMTDFLNEHVWDLVPGSDEWNRLVVDETVQAALDANRTEWVKDIRDRVFPLTGEDGEFRSLNAFDHVMTDDETFQVMSDVGMFDTNDLLIDDETGLPRVRAIWEKRQRGEATPDELEWLQERLVSAYFAAGDVEVLPGFTFMDWLHLNSPGIAVNLINKSEDSGIPVRTEEHADFKARYINKLTGRLQNVPAGEEGLELIVEARRRGWLVSRKTEDWVLDAAHAAYRSRQRAVRGVWEWVSHRTWAAGTKKSIADKEFVLGEREARILTAAGFPSEAGQVWTYGDFYDELSDYDKQLRVATPTFLDTMSRGVVFGALNRHDDQLGAGLIEMLDEADKFFRDQGIDSIEDWPEESKAEARTLFSAAVDLGYISEEDYAQEMEGFFGPLNYQPPVPPKVEDLDTGLRLTGEQLDDMDVVDGDTVAVWTEDGPMRVRIIGINAPEVTQEGYAEAREALAKLLEDADEVVLGVWKPELFGMSQQSAPGARRLLAWLYVDGVPVYDPTVFSADNPRGAGVGGRVLDLVALRDAEVERQRAAGEASAAAQRARLESERSG